MTRDGSHPPTDGCGVRVRVRVKVRVFGDGDGSKLDTIFQQFDLTVIMESHIWTPHTRTHAHK